jgi:hypothetical protein
VLNLQSFIDIQYPLYAKHSDQVTSTIIVIKSHPLNIVIKSHPQNKVIKSHPQNIVIKSHSKILLIVSHPQQNDSNKED